MERVEQVEVRLFLCFVISLGAWSRIRVRPVQAFVFLEMFLETFSVASRPTVPTLYCCSNVGFSSKLR